MYFFIFFLQITKFPCKELPVLPIFSRPAGWEGKDWESFPGTLHNMLEPMHNLMIMSPMLYQSSMDITEFISSDSCFNIIYNMKKAITILKTLREKYTTANRSSVSNSRAETEQQNWMFFKKYRLHQSIVKSAFMNLPPRIRRKSIKICYFNYLKI